MTEWTTARVSEGASKCITEMLGVCAQVPAVSIEGQWACECRNMQGEQSRVAGM